MKLTIKDRYFHKKGGTCKVLDISCAKCGEFLFTYQKDGPGWLRRCYLNRILGTDKYANLKILKCPKCKTLIGNIINHHDERQAFNLKRGNFKRVYNKTYGKNKK